MARQRAAAGAADLTFASVSPRAIYARMSNPKRHHKAIFAVIPSVLTFATAFVTAFAAIPYECRMSETGNNGIALVKADAPISPILPLKFVDPAAGRLSLIMR